VILRAGGGRLRNEPSCTLWAACPQRFRPALPRHCEPGLSTIPALSHSGDSREDFQRPAPLLLSSHARKASLWRPAGAAPPWKRDVVPCRGSARLVLRPPRLAPLRCLNHTVSRQAVQGQAITRHRRQTITRTQTIRQRPPLTAGSRRWHRSQPKPHSRSP
jgi:hypothetical protein